MPALFGRESNRIVRRILLGAAALALVVPLALMAWVRSPFRTGEGSTPPQPVRFSHRLHVTGFRIDCRYCHASVERAARAGMPPTSACLPCHNAVWREGPWFEPVRRSLASGRPIPWTRVNNLPDFVFFNHAIHVTKGVGCETCHGRVDRMDQLRQTAPLTMGWCLDCHRDPAPHLRPQDRIVSMGWRPSGDPRAAGTLLARSEHVRPSLTCSACHR